MREHDGGVHGVAGGESLVLVHQAPRPVHQRRRDGQDLWKEPSRQIIYAPTLGPAAERPVAVQDLLKRSRVQRRLDLATRSKNRTPQPKRAAYPPAAPFSNWAA
jgi:hypothetical protein